MLDEILKKIQKEEQMNLDEINEQLTQIEQMLDKIIRTANKSEKVATFEIGSNSDLILENLNLS